MTRPRSLRAKLIFLIPALALFTCAPIWGVQYFVNQDGSGHIHGAWMMIRLLQGDPRVHELFQFNLISFPDVSGHWLLAFFLLIMPAFTATKVMMTLTYLGLVAAVAWLRWRTAGGEGLTTSILIGAALTFNSLWLVGYYNFNIGLIAAIFTAGSYYRWREAMDIRRAAALALLLIFIFLSHIVSFVVAGAAIAALCLLPLAAATRRNIVWTAVAFIPVSPLVALYRLSTEAGGTLEPIWRSLHDPSSISNWLTQFRGVDSFIIISRRTFPFVQSESDLFAIFAPVIWIVLAFTLLFVSTWIRGRTDANFWRSRHLPFAVLAVIFICVSIVSPDHFKLASSTGGVLRERIFLSGLTFLVPLFRTDNAAILGKLAKAALVFVILYQTAAVWEYAVRGDSDVREFLSAAPQVPAGSSLAAITIVPKGMRFSANPISSLGNYIGIGRDVFVWDNYEFGHYLFPLVARKKEDQEWALEYTGGNTFELNNPDSYSEERLSKLGSALERGNQRIETLLVWGEEPRIDSVWKPYFENEPYYTNGRVRLYRHR